MSFKDIAKATQKQGAAAKKFDSARKGTYPAGSLAVIDPEEAPSLLYDLQSRSTAFHGFTEEEIGLLAARVTLVRCKDGLKVVHQDEEATFIAIIIAGTIKVTQTDPAGKNEKEVASMSSGDILGEIAFFEGGKRTTSCIAQGQVLIGILTYDEVEALHVASPAIGLKLMDKLSETIARKLERVFVTMDKKLHQSRAAGTPPREVEGTLRDLASGGVGWLKKLTRGEISQLASRLTMVSYPAEEAVALPPPQGSVGGGLPVVIVTKGTVAVTNQSSLGETQIVEFQAGQVLGAPSKTVGWISHAKAVGDVSLGVIYSEQVPALNAASPLATYRLLLKVTEANTRLLPDARNSGENRLKEVTEKIPLAKQLQTYKKRKESICVFIDQHNDKPEKLASCGRISNIEAALKGQLKPHDSPKGNPRMAAKKAAGMGAVLEDAEEVMQAQQAQVADLQAKLADMQQQLQHQHATTPALGEVAEGGAQRADSGDKEELARLNRIIEAQGEELKALRKRIKNANQRSATSLLAKINDTLQENPALKQNPKLRRVSVKLDKAAQLRQLRANATGGNPIKKAMSMGPGAMLRAPLVDSSSDDGGGSSEDEKEEADANVPKLQLDLSKYQKSDNMGEDALTTALEDVMNMITVQKQVYEDKLKRQEQVSADKEAEQARLQRRYDDQVKATAKKDGELQALRTQYEALRVQAGIEQDRLQGEWDRMHAEHAKAQSDFKLLLTESRKLSHEYDMLKKDARQTYVIKEELRAANEVLAERKGKLALVGWVSLVKKLQDGMAEAPTLWFKVMTMSLMKQKATDSRQLIRLEKDYEKNSASSKQFEEQAKAEIESMKAELAMAHSELREATERSESLQAQLDKKKEECLTLQQLLDREEAKLNTEVQRITAKHAGELGGVQDINRELNHERMLIVRMLNIVLPRMAQMEDCFGSIVRPYTLEEARLISHCWDIVQELPSEIKRGLPPTPHWCWPSEGGQKGHGPLSETIVIDHDPRSRPVEGGGAEQSHMQMYVAIKRPASPPKGEGPEAAAARAQERAASTSSASRFASPPPARPGSTRGGTLARGLTPKLRPRSASVGRSLSPTGGGPNPEGRYSSAAPNVIKSSLPSDTALTPQGPTSTAAPTVNANAPPSPARASSARSPSNASPSTTSPTRAGPVRASSGRRAAQRPSIQRSSPHVSFQDMAPAPILASPAGPSPRKKGAGGQFWLPQGGRMEDEGVSKEQAREKRNPGPLSVVVGDDYNLKPPNIRDMTLGHATPLASPQPGHRELSPVPPP